MYRFESVHFEHTVYYDIRIYRYFVKYKILPTISYK